MTDTISPEVIRLAIDIVLRDVRYSNSMPDWYVAQTLDYSRRVEVIGRKIASYLAGAVPRPAFAVLVPRRSGIRDQKLTDTWVVPSVNDQMILQTCASALAPKIDQMFDRRRVFSYRYNTSRDTTALVEDQCQAWMAFRAATQRQASSCKHLLFLDLEQAYASANRAEFLKYLSQFSSGVEIRLLAILLDHFTPVGAGLPLINYSLFFLGNAYFSVVDNALSKHTGDFIRFVDDYCVFGASERDMEALYKRLARDLVKLGFKINDIKLRSVSSEQYCAALSSAGSSGPSTGEEGMAYSQVPTNAVSPREMLASVAETIKNPARFLNDGVGLIQLSALRKLRDTLPEPSRKTFVNELASRAEIVRSSLGLLTKYVHDAKELWRSVWLLYLLKDVSADALADKALQREYRAAFESIEGSPSAPGVVKLWARAGRGPAVTPEAIVEELSELDYEEAGRRVFGG